MAIRKEHLEFHSLDLALGWRTPAGYPDGIQEKILAGALDENAKAGNRTRLLRFEPGCTYLCHIRARPLGGGFPALGRSHRRRVMGKSRLRPMARTLTLAVLPACITVPSGRRMAAFCSRSIITIPRERVRPDELGRRSAGSALRPPLGQRRKDCPRATAGEGGGEARSFNWHRQGPARAANQHIYRRGHLALVPIRNVSKGRRSLFRARNGMTAFARTPSLPEVILVARYPPF